MPGQTKLSVGAAGPPGLPGPTPEAAAEAEPEPCRATGSWCFVLPAGHLVCIQKTPDIFSFNENKLCFSNIYFHNFQTMAKPKPERGALSPSLRKLNSIFKAPTTTYTHPHTHLRRTWKGEERQGSCSCSSVSARCCMQALSYRLYCLSHTWPHNCVPVPWLLCLSRYTHSHCRSHWHCRLLRSMAMRAETEMA